MKPEQRAKDAQDLARLILSTPADQPIPVPRPILLGLIESAAEAEQQFSEAYDALARATEQAMTDRANYGEAMRQAEQLRYKVQVLREWATREAGEWKGLGEGHDQRAAAQMRSDALAEVADRLGKLLAYTT